MPSKLYYKAVRKDGTSHYDSKTLWTPGVEIVVPDAVLDSKPCGVGIHGSPTLLGAVGYQGGPSRYLTFEPTSECLGEDKDKARFRSVMPGEWLSAEEIDAIAGFKLHEVNNPVNPLLLESTLPLPDAVELLKQWDSVGYSVRDSVRYSVRYSVRTSVRDSVGYSVRYSVRDSVRDSVGASVRDSVGASVRDSVGDSIWDSVWDSVRDSIWDSIWAYTGSLFTNITEWKNAESLGATPWEPNRQLWLNGYVPSFDGKVWRLHTGADAAIAWEGTL